MPLPEWVLSSHQTQELPSGVPGISTGISLPLMSVCVYGGVVEVSVWGGSGHLRDVAVASVTLLLSADLGTALLLVVWPLL